MPPRKNNAPALVPAASVEAVTDVATEAQEPEVIEPRVLTDIERIMRSDT
jgi:hypothetical protein